MSAHLQDKHRIRLGVVGFGRFGSLHAHTVHGLAECQLVVVVEPNAQRLELAGQTFPGVLTLASLSQALDAADVDGWIIASSTASHIANASQILQRGGRVLIEKPLATSLGDAKSIQAWVHADASNVMMGHVALFGSEFTALVRQARQRTPIRFIDAVRHRPATTSAAYPGESPVHLTMVHDLYCIQVLMRREEPTHMSAHVLDNERGQPYLACAQLQWSDRAMASLTASFLTPSGMPSDGFDRWEVFGDDWAARIETNPRPIQVWDDLSRHPLTLEIHDQGNAVSGMLAEELRCFCRVLQGVENVPMGATYADALQVQRWLETLSMGD